MAEEIKETMAAAEETKAPAKKTVAKKAAAKKAEAPEAAEKKPAAKKTAAKKTAEKAPAKETEGKLSIRLVRSICGRGKEQSAVAISLGLKRPGDVALQPDNAATAGKINKIAHLVSVTKA